MGWGVKRRGIYTMYINRTTRYYDNNGEYIRKQDFLILFSDPDIRELRGVVRKVAMKQCGHFMMGCAFIKGEKHILSGSYGADGLTNDGFVRNPETKIKEPTKAWEVAIPLPDSLVKAWSNGGGWNSAGNEAEAMALWSRKNINALKLGKQGKYKICCIDDNGDWKFLDEIYFHKKDAEKDVKNIQSGKKPFVVKLPE